MDGAVRAWAGRKPDAPWNSSDNASDCISDAGGQQSGGLLAAGSFREETDELILMSQQDQFRTREKCQPGQIAAGGWYWLAA